MKKVDDKALYVHMLGEFHVNYGTNAISFGRNNLAKSVQLFQIMVLNKKTGVSKGSLIQYLYGRDEVENGNSSLNNTLFRLRKLLESAGLPKDNYITVQNGMCRWNEEIPIYADIYEFEELTAKGMSETDEINRLFFLKEACKIYHGEFLPMMVGEEWAMAANIHYQEVYFSSLRIVCEELDKQREYEEILRLTTAAAQVYPFEEWQIWRIDSLIAMNRYKEAMDVYQDATKMFFDELGLSPSKKMMERFQVMSSHIQQPVRTIVDIKEGLKEENERKGAYYCTLPSFIDNYRILSRMMERTGQSVFLMLCTLTDSSGTPLESPKKLQEVSQKFQMAIQRSLRRGDLYTRYSPCQFLLLLPGTNKENCSIISTRIDRNFKDEGGGRNKINYYTASVADMKNGSGKLNFVSGDLKWV